MAKSIKQHLEDLPEPARAAALANMWWEDAGNKYQEQKAALKQAFNWSRSPQGWHYWQGVYDKITLNDSQSVQP